MVDIYGKVMPVERFEPSTLAGLVFETSAYTVPPHRLVEPIERITSTEKKPTTSEIHAKQDVQKAYHRVEPTSIARIDSRKILLWQERCLMRETY